MIDPARLLASATRLYGEHMDTLWGAFQPVPAANVTVLDISAAALDKAKERLGDRAGAAT